MAVETMTPSHTKPLDPLPPPTLPDTKVLLMRCLNCGSDMQTAPENVQYEGLPGVTLADVEVSRCHDCGEYEVAVPELDGLVNALAWLVVHKPSRLAAEEIRLLRNALDWSGADLAQHLGVGRSTVSRWENGHEPIGAQADRTLRLAVVVGRGFRDFELGALRSVARTPSGPTRLRMRHGASGWEQQRAAA